MYEWKECAKPKSYPGIVSNFSQNGQFILDFGQAFGRRVRVVASSYEWTRLVFLNSFPSQLQQTDAQVKLIFETNWKNTYCEWQCGHGLTYWWGALRLHGTILISSLFEIVDQVWKSQTKNEEENNRYCIIFLGDLTRHVIPNTWPVQFSTFKNNHKCGGGRRKKFDWWIKTPGLNFDEGLRNYTFARTNSFLLKQKLNYNEGFETQQQTWTTQEEQAKSIHGNEGK